MATFNGEILEQAIRPLLRMEVPRRILNVPIYPRPSTSPDQSGFPARYGFALSVDLDRLEEITADEYSSYMYRRGNQATDGSIIIGKEFIRASLAAECPPGIDPYEAMQNLYIETDRQIHGMQLILCGWIPGAICLPLRNSSQKKQSERANEELALRKYRSESGINGMRYIHNAFRQYVNTLTAGVVNGSLALSDLKDIATVAFVKAKDYLAKGRKVLPPSEEEIQEYAPSKRETTYGLRDVYEAYERAGFTLKSSSLVRYPILRDIDAKAQRHVIQYIETYGKSARKDNPLKVITNMETFGFDEASLVGALVATGWNFTHRIDGAHFTFTAYPKDGTSEQEQLERGRQYIETYLSRQNQDEEKELLWASEDINLTVTEKLAEEYRRKGYAVSIQTSLTGQIVGFTIGPAIRYYTKGFNYGQDFSSIIRQMKTDMEAGFIYTTPTSTRVIGGLIKPSEISPSNIGHIEAFPPNMVHFLPDGGAIKSPEGLQKVGQEPSWAHHQASRMGHTQTPPREKPDSGKQRESRDHEQVLKFERRYRVSVPIGSQIKCGVGHDLNAYKMAACVLDAEAIKAKSFNPPCICRAVRTDDIRDRILAVSEKQKG